MLSEYIFIAVILLIFGSAIAFGIHIKILDNNIEDVCFEQNITLCDYLKCNIKETGKIWYLSTNSDEDYFNLCMEE